MRLRVLHTVESLRQDAGAVGIYLPGLFDALRSRGVESAVMTSDGKTEGRNPGGKVPIISLRSSGYFNDVDVVHIHGWGHPLLRAAANEARKTGKPCVLSPLGALGAGARNGGGWRKRIHARFFDKRLIRAAAAVTTINDMEEHQLSRHRLNARCVRLVCGLRVSDYERRPSPSDGANGARLLLVLAPIHPAEGFVPLLKALAELGTLADGWNVVLAGRPVANWQKMLEAAIRRKGGADRVQFATAPDLQTQRDWLSRASLLVAPSLHVRCPVSVLQGLGAGVPVLATSCVTPERFQALVRSCAPTRGDMKIALRALLQLSDEERAEAGRRARDAGRALFDWSILVNEYIRLYENVVSS